MTQSELREKIDGRDAAHRLLARLTTGTVLGALAGVGVFGYVSAATIPGKSDATAATASTSSTSSSSTDQPTSSEDDSSSSSGLSTSSGSVSSSSGTSAPIAVTGGSR